MTLLIALLGLAVVLVAAAWLWYSRWLRRVTTHASAESHHRETARGPVEYDDRGAGPVVLHFHGGNVGHNGWFILEHLVDAGYRLLTPDRPGYLGTPLDHGGSPAAQADLAAALLDTLGIERVAVVGVSAGGPGAIEFAARFPDRTAALVLLSAISQRTGLSSDQTDSTLGRLVLTKRFQDPAYFLIDQAMHRMTALALRDMVRTETTYDDETGKRLIEQVVGDPAQKRSVLRMADAMVPAGARFDGVTNDLEVQQALEPLPLAEIAAPTLIIGSTHDGDIGWENSVNANEGIAGSELVAVEQFGHMIWWGDAQVTRDIQARIEGFLATALPTQPT